MQRSSIIATVVAAGGVLIAGSVASVAVINAASSNAPESTTVALVAAGSTAEATTEAATQEPSESPEPSATATPESLPSLTSEPLPEIPVVTNKNVTVQKQVAAAPAQQYSAPQSQPSKSKPTAQKTKAAQVSEISSSQAASIVLKAAGGESVTSVSKTTRQGTRAWAVTVQRSDGSVLTGYANRKNGTVFDWVTVKDAPAAPTASASSHDDDHESDDHDDDHESDDHDDHDDEHEGDDD